MERHKCKLCSKVFGNGKALGGHMRSHLATLPIPPKTQQQQQLVGDPTESASSLSFSDDEEERGNEDTEEKALVYGLRENPKKSFRLVDPEFLDAGSIVQDRESETESSRNPSRRRSNRARKKGFTREDDHPNQGLKKAPKLGKPSSAESAAALEPVSSVSDASPEENVAMCLVMLSRDTWSSDDSEELRLSQNLRKQQFRAPSNFEDIKSASERGRNGVGAKNKNNADQKLHECPICFKVFGSGQALGGHKRSHFASSSANNKLTSDSKNPAKFGEISLIDLNLPAPMEDEELSQLELSAVYNPE